jgi:hypothetical protein
MDQQNFGESDMSEDLTHLIFEASEKYGLKRKPFIDPLPPTKLHTSKPLLKDWIMATKKPAKKMPMKMPGKGPSKKC